MKNIPFFTILIITSLCIIIAQGKLSIEYVTIEGLEYFKSHNLSSDKALKSINSTALKALKNNRPYSVINTTVIPPNKNKQEYFSYAPYFWPFCDGITNVTDPETQCPYKQRDGKVNCDVKILSDPDDSTNMVRAVLSLSISYQLYNCENFAKKAVELLDVWFVNKKTRMLSEVNYGQVVRGPHEWKGRKEGILDMRFYVYIPAATRILKKSSAWNSNIDKGVKKWFANFSDWLISSKLGKEEGNATNNHATFYVAQLATYLDFSGRTDEARDYIKKFANTKFKFMILKSGKQPKESIRTRPYHYQCFNLEALTYIAILSQNINGTNLWETKTKYGATIKNAVDYLIPEANEDGKEDKTVLLPALYKARDHYGDNSGKYADTMIKLLKKAPGSYIWWTVYSPKSVV